MDEELKSILDRGLKIVYDGEGHLKRWEWRDNLEQKLNEYFENQSKREEN
jgi:YD repeat-containing protein